MILELVGAPNLGDNLKALATQGRIVVIGIGAGAKGELNLAALMGTRGRIMGSTLRARPLEEKALAMREVERHVLPLVESGAVEVPVAETFSLDDAEAAYDRFAEGGKIGKIVLTLRPSADGAQPLQQAHHRRLDLLPRGLGLREFAITIAASPSAPSIRWASGFTGCGRRLPASIAPCRPAMTSPSP